MSVSSRPDQRSALRVVHHDRHQIGLPGDVTPHHLLLTDREVREQGFSTATKVAPPLRSEEHRQALLEALADGTIDALTSDHSPHHGVPGGSLAPGSPGDLTLLDLEREVTVDPKTFRSKGRSTPFAGWTLTGAPAGTVVAGRPVRLDG